jgi:hypothetical protein
MWRGYTHPMDANDSILALRRAARASKAASDLALLNAHQCVAERLANPAEYAALRQRALAQVSLWECNRLCHSRYIQAWRSLLSEPVGVLRAAMLRNDSEGVALRQNTPFGFALG